MMRIIICDDENIAREQLKQCIEDYNEDIPEHEIILYESGEELVADCKKGFSADIVFLDIELNMLDGIDTAKLIRSYDKDAIIIFVSSHDERVFDTFDCEPFHFIVKPFDQTKFHDVFKKALNKYKLYHNCIEVKWKNTTIRLPVQSIKYVEKLHKHIIFHTYDGEYETVGTLGDTLKTLAPYGFLQTHQGYVVNMNLIKRFENNDIILADGTKVMMSVRKKVEVYTRYADYIRRNK